MDNLILDGLLCFAASPRGWTALRAQSSCRLPRCRSLAWAADRPSAGTAHPLRAPDHQRL